MSRDVLPARGERERCRRAVPHRNAIVIAFALANSPARRTFCAGGPSEAIMLRLTVVLALILGAAMQGAAAQIGTFPGVAPPTPSPFASAPQLGGAPAAPQVVPGPRLPGNFAAPRTVVPVAPVASGRPVLVPGGLPGRHDRYERCLMGGAAAGIGPNALGPFAA